MKKLSILLVLAFVCGSFAMAQTSTVNKKATLMPDGAVITDLKTGEVQRTTSGTVAVPSSISANLTINGVPAGPGTTSKTAPTGGVNSVPTMSYTSSSSNNGPASTSKSASGSNLNSLQAQPNTLSTSTNSGPASTLKSAGNGVTNLIQPVVGGTPTNPTTGSAPPANSGVVKPPVNSNQTFTVD